MEMVWGKIENGAQAGVSAAAAALEKAGVNFDLSSVVASQEQLSATGISSGYFARSNICFITIYNFHFPMKFF